VNGARGFSTPLRYFLCRYFLRTPSVILWPWVGVVTTATIRGGVWLLVTGCPGVGVTRTGDAGVEFDGGGPGAVGAGEPAGGFELGWSAIATSMP
jgi:hypothetical protein